MKKLLIYSFMFVVGLTFVACSEDDLDKQSVITADKVQMTPFDYWLNANYVDPYNIKFQYRYEDKETDMNYTTIPAEYNQCIKLAHIIKYMCIEAYDEVAGVDFTRAYFPKHFLCIGEFEYKNNGTYILGTAEGGKKINMMGVNYLNQYVNSIANLNHYYIKTIHHEFTHILNQTRNFSADFQLITGSDYVADSWSDVSGWLAKGFITQYAQHSDTEDFAEMLSEYITNSEDVWATRMTNAGTDGAALIGQKLDIVRDYMKSTFNIDIDELRAAIMRRQDDVAAGKIDLTSLDV